MHVVPNLSTQNSQTTKLVVYPQHVIGINIVIGINYYRNKYRNK